MDKFRSGWYGVSYSDGGMDYTSDGPVWLDTPFEFAELINGAWETMTDTHIPYWDYYGDGDEPSDEPMG